MKISLAVKQFTVRKIYYICGLFAYGIRNFNQGWSGGAMVLGKLPVPGRPTHLDFSRTMAYCACSRCG